MKLTLYKSKTLKNCANYVVNQLATKFDKKNLKIRHYVIVPDRASFEMEKLVLNALGGTMNVEVKTFKRLGNMVTTPQENYLSKQAGIMALHGIIADNKDKLECYTKGISTPGFVANMYDTISMLKYCRIKPEDLQKSGLSVSVKAKMKDIATLYQAYLDYTASGNYIDSADKIDDICNSIEQLCTKSDDQQAIDYGKKEIITDSYFYICDFDNLSVQELAIVEQLVRYSKGVTVTCACSDDTADKYLYLNDIATAVENLCKKLNIEPEKVQQADTTPQSQDNELKDITKQIGKYLYHYQNPTAIESNGLVQKFCGNTREDEVYALAVQIAKYVRLPQKDASTPCNRYNDIYVVTSDVNKYLSAVATIFDEFDIPYFVDTQFNLSEHVYTRFIMDYIALWQSNKKLSAVLPFVKNALFIEDNGKFDERVYDFENYCLKYKVSYDYKKFDLAKSESIFEGADAIREKLQNIIANVTLADEDRATNYIANIRKLIDFVKLKDRNNTFAQLQKQQKLVAEAKVTEQVAEKLSNVISTAESVLGGRTMKLDDFASTLSSALASVNISVIPQKNDAVVFANMAKARNHNIKFLALLGANYGAMPIVKKENGLLSDQNITELCNCDIKVEPLIATENKREKFSLYQLLQEPTKMLWISYPEADGTSTLLPSSFVDDISKLFYVVDSESKAHIDLPTQREIPQDIFTKRQAVTKLIKAKRELEDGLYVNMPTYESIYNAYKDEIDSYFNTKDAQNISVSCGTALYLGNDTTTVSKLTAYYECPYKFYMRYGLGIKPRVVAELQSSDLGTILHAVLENYVKNADTNETDKETEDKAKKIFDDIMSSEDFYKSLAKDKSMTGILSALKKESMRVCKVIKQQLSKSSFVNYETELEFGPGKTAPAVEVAFNGGKFKLIGTVDRVDTCGDNFIIIDYKSGKTASEYKESKLYLGLKMQLLVYLNAVKQYTGKVPVGYYYLNIHDNFNDSNDNGIYYYNGRTIDSFDIATQIANEWVDGKNERLGLKLNKTMDKFDGHSKRFLSPTEMSKQESYAFEMIKKAGEQMVDGYAGISPCKGACDYCDYQSICDYNDIYNYDERDDEGASYKTINEVVK